MLEKLYINKREYKNTLPLSISTKNVITNLGIPFILYTIFNTSNSWQMCILIYILSILIINKKYVLTFILFSSFFNLMNLKNTPSWLGLIPTFGMLLLLWLRGIISLSDLVKKRQKGISLVIFLGILLFMWISFYSISMNSFFVKTGLKSSIQLSFIVLIAYIFSKLQNKWLIYNIEILKNYGIYFLIFYIFFACFTFDEDKRMQGFVGAQGLALTLCLLSTLFISDKKYVLLFLILILLTGSRTYIGAYLFIYIINIIFYQTKKTANIFNLISLTIILTISLQIVSSASKYSNRLNTKSEDFSGSFYGRFRNYSEGIKLIEENPIVGNGMGSMLIALKKGYYEIAFPIYLQRGDTSIIHNEYIRIAIEMGLIGLFIFLSLLWGGFKYSSSFISKSAIIYLSIGSITENVFTNYSSGMIVFMIIFWSFANTSSIQISNKLK